MRHPRVADLELSQVLPPHRDAAVAMQASTTKFVDHRPGPSALSQEKLFYVITVELCSTEDDCLRGHSIVWYENRCGYSTTQTELMRWEKKDERGERKRNREGVSGSESGCMPAWTSVDVAA